MLKRSLTQDSTCNTTSGKTKPDSSFTPASPSTAGLISRLPMWALELGIQIHHFLNSSSPPLIQIAYIIFRSILPYTSPHPQNISLYIITDRIQNHTLTPTPSFTPQHLAPRPRTHPPSHGATRRLRHRHIRLPPGAMAASEREDAISRRVGRDTQGPDRRVRHRAIAVVSGGGEGQ